MMSGSNIPTLSPLLSLLIFFSVSSIQLSFCIGTNIIFCPKIEKQSLLSFKQSLKDSNNQLSSWDDTLNCCKWEGVICNNLTGHVHKLRLRNSNPGEFEGLKGKISPSLVNLKYLRYLDLSGNALSGKRIPSFVGSLASLEYLNLSGTGFHGQVPHSLGNLSNLRALDLDGFQANNLNVDRLEWVTGLSQLEYLNMNSVNLSKAHNWAQVINSLPSLVEFHFKYCSLDFMAPLDYVNITSSLKHVDLYFNSLSSVTIMPWIVQLTNLVSLDLSSNLFDGPIPTVSNATKLQYIDLSYNRFNSSIPDWFYLCKDLEHLDLSLNLLNGVISNSVGNLTSLSILYARSNQLSGKIPKEISNLCKLQQLHLSGNNLQGDISDSFGDMSKCFLDTLEILDLEVNKLSGHFTNQFGEFKSLEYLFLGENSLSGVIPINIGKLSSLQILWLQDNKLTGTVPESLCQLFNLQMLDIANNMLEGIVTETHFANLTKLQSFSASTNHLTLKLNPNWVPPFQLTNLQLGSWNLGVGSKIPSWIEKQKNIQNLDLSDTGISGKVPTWVWKIRILDLSHNNLCGNITDIPGIVDQYIYLGSNRFTGSLPRISATTVNLDLSNNSFSGGISHFLCDATHETYGLSLLHLGGNQLSGELPDCWMKWPYLSYLNLGNNNISGSIPSSIGYLADLRSLNLYGNKLSGRIPFTMHNCTKLVMMDVADNDLDGGVPTWVGTDLAKLTFLILRSNKLSGNIPSEMCHLSSLQILDLSDNSFSGKIPRCLFNLTAMATKGNVDPSANFYDSNQPTLGDSASVVIKGHVLLYESTLFLVTTIDLSVNNLSGDIPEELTSLVELRSLNLSGNHLTGSIPEKIGDMKQLESLDFSRNSLSGQIPNSFKLLSLLAHLNLSHNKLTGRIPESTQLRGFDASSFTSNKLCGPPLTIMCDGDGDGGGEHVEENEEEGADESKIEWFYVVLSLGYAVGFSAVCSALVLNKSWREGYFGLLERIWDVLYVYVQIKWIKLTKPSHLIF